MAVKPKTKSISDKKMTTKSKKKIAKVDSSPVMKKVSPKKKIEKTKKVGISTNKKELVKKSASIKPVVKVEISKDEIKNSKKLKQKSVLSEKDNLPVKSVKVKKEKPKKSVAKNVVKVETEKAIVPEVKENKKLKIKKVTEQVAPTKKSKTVVQKAVDVKKEEIQSIKSKKRKHSESTEEASEGSSGLVKKDVKKFVTALLKISSDQEENKKKIFDSDQVPVFLYVTCIKVPKAPLHQLRIPLPHSLVLPTDDVALFVRDLKKGRKIGFENTVTHYEDLLRQHGVTRVKTVIPMNQVKTEYRQFELRKKLLGLHDHFLIDGRIAGHMSHLLGKIFRTKRKLPTSIHMDKKDLKKEIDNALQKTILQVHSNGDGFVTQVGYNSMSVKDIADNIFAVSKALEEHFPGGWENIRKLAVKTPTSLSIPIYITLKNKNDVEVPVQAPKRPKAYKPVEGELLTSTKNLKVIVAPDGTVDVVKVDDGSDAENEDNEDDVEVKDEEDEDEDEDEDDEEEEEDSKASELDEDED